MILNKKQKGFTLLELVIYVGLLAVFATGMVNVSNVIFKMRTQTAARNEVEQNLRFAMEKLTTDIRLASTTSGSYPGNALTLTLPTSTVSYALSSGILQRTENGSTVDITTSKVIATSTDGNIFTKVDQPPAESSFQIKLKIKYNSLNPYLVGIENNVQTSVSLRE